MLIILMMCLKQAILLKQMEFILCIVQIKLIFPDHLHYLAVNMMKVMTNPSEKDQVLFTCKRLKFHKTNDIDTVKILCRTIINTLEEKK